MAAYCRVSTDQAEQLSSYEAQVQYYTNYINSESKHIDDEVLYQAFINAFNALIENKDYFMGKWKERLESDNVLVQYKAKQLIEIITRDEIITEFNIDLYFVMVEKITVHESGRLIVRLIDATDVECEIE